MIQKLKLPKDPILILYFITAAILLLDVTNNFPFIEILRKIKYPMLFIMFADAIRERKFILGHKTLIILSFFFLHTILFGVFYINPQVADLTNIHFREMMIYLIFLTLTVEMLTRKNCYLEFLEGMCVVFAFFFLWIGLTHFADFVNPLYYPMVLMRRGRIRSAFGTASPNYIGYYAFIALVFYYLLFFEWKRRRILTKGKIQMLLGICVWVTCILFSTASRSSILSLFVFLLVCFVFQFPKFTPGTRVAICVAVILAMVLLFSVFGESIWNESNRNENITINMPVFNELNARNTGMGYIESSGFYLDLYGYDTWPVDIYYLYIFLTTGILGSILIFTPLVIILLVYLFKKKNTTQFILFAAYIALLFDGFWQVNLFTYRFIASLFISAILLYFMGNVDEKIGDECGTIEAKEQVS